MVPAIPANTNSTNPLILFPYPVWRHGKRAEMNRNKSSQGFLIGPILLGQSVRVLFYLNVFDTSFVRDAEGIIVPRKPPGV